MDRGRCQLFQLLVWFILFVNVVDIFVFDDIIVETDINFADIDIIVGYNVVDIFVDIIVFEGYHC